MKKKIVRIMTFSDYYAHSAPFFRDLKILTSDKLIVHLIGIAMYKLHNGYLVFLYSVWFIYNIIYIYIYK